MTFDEECNAALTRLEKAHTAQQEAWHDFLKATTVDGRGQRIMSNDMELHDRWDATQREEEAAKAEVRRLKDMIRRG